ncbi:MAG: ISL3 family transposase [Deltaproteobacteria bacterium]|nr:ISL3 family transposase [Deltaproteobacteria bacterium]
MRDIELYERILGITPPWKVVNVELDLKAEQVVVMVDAGGGPFPCPECQTTVPGYDTWIEAEVPRVQCPTHGVKQIRVPWAEPGSQFTALLERLAIDLLRECSVTGAAELLRITWDEAWGIKSRAVARGLARRTHEGVPHLGVDEKAFAKRHRYCTVVADLDESRVLYVADERKRESLDGFWPTLTPAQREGIQAIAMDMWEPYIQSTQAHLAGAEDKIVFDKFHLAKHIHDAVDQVRRGEHRALKRADDDRLTGTKYLWLMRPQAMTPEQRATLRALLRSDLKVARAWSLKERFRQFWDYRYLGVAQKFFARWFWRATHSRLKPMAEVAKLIRRHFPNILTYLRHGITNAGLEAVNATIQWVKKTARGFRNVEHFKTAIYFHCGGLDLYPHETR